MSHRYKKIGHDIQKRGKDDTPLQLFLQPLGPHTPLVSNLSDVI
jgi:hypothetical protein